MSTFDGLVSRLHSGDREDVCQAARSLGDLGDQRAVPILIQLLRSTSDHGVKNAIAIALQELANPVAVEPLLQEIREPKNFHYSGTLIWALGSMNARAAVVDLAHVVCRSEFEAVLMAIGVMHEFHGPLECEKQTEAIEILEGCLNQEHAHDWRRGMVGDAIEFLRTYDASV